MLNHRGWTGLWRNKASALIEDDPFVAVVLFSVADGNQLARIELVSMFSGIDKRFLEPKSELRLEVCRNFLKQQIQDRIKIECRWKA